MPCRGIVRRNHRREPQSGDQIVSRRLSKQMRRLQSCSHSGDNDLTRQRDGFPIRSQLSCFHVSALLLAYQLQTACVNKLARSGLPGQVKNRFGLVASGLRQSEGLSHAASPLHFRPCSVHLAGCRASRRRTVRVQRRWNPCPGTAWGIRMAQPAASSSRLLIMSRVALIISLSSLLRQFQAETNKQNGPHKDQHSEQVRMDR